MSPLRWLWLLLAVWGAVHPWIWIGRWLAETGSAPFTLLAHWGADAASRGLGVNLLITSAALFCFILAETLVRKNWEALLAIPALCIFGPACGLPLYLFLRAAPIR